MTNVAHAAIYGANNGGPNRATRRAIRYKRGSKMTSIKGTLSPLALKLLDPYLLHEQAPIASDLETQALYSPV